MVSATSSIAEFGRSRWTAPLAGRTFLLDGMGVKQHTTAALHPSPRELAEFACGSLDEVRRAIVEGHVYGCDRCADAVATAPMDAFVDQLRIARLSEAGSTPDFEQRLPDTVGVPLDNAPHRLPRELADHPRFQAERLLAEGSMGLVYLARDGRSNTPIVLKILRPEVAGDVRLAARFQREAMLVGKLRHPHIARMIECGTVGGVAFLAVEFVPGLTLAQMVVRRGPLPVDAACQCIRQAALGLQCAADAGVVHRDLKPHNLIIQPNGTLKILDFGLGRLVDEQRSGSRLTREGDIVGTLHYIAPEQAAHSQGADVRSDIYALGCTFYYLLAGEPPFQGRNAVEVLKMHEATTPASLSQLRSDVPAQINALVQRMLAKHPDQRPQAPREIAAALGRSAPARAFPGPTQPMDVRRSAPLWQATLASCATPAVLLPLATIAMGIGWLALR